MSIRDTIQKNQPATLAITVVVICISLALTIRSTSRGIPKVTQAYFSNDDGKTYFVDDIKKVFPFDYSGKSAYRVHVFKCASGTPFVGVLERIPEEALARIKTLQEPGSSKNVGQIDEIMVSSMEVKRPGETKWFPRGSAEYATITGMIKCPDGESGPIVGVVP